MKLVAFLSLLYGTFAFSMPNPSALYCLDMGGDYETRTTSTGAQDGVCKFVEDGVMSECGGWAYLLDNCNPGECALWSVDMNACEHMMGE